MREYKFRGKRPFNGGWVYGFLMDWEGKRPSIFVQNGDVDEETGDVDYIDYTVDPETVGQYTGLHDKNGKEIYEGDILRLWRSVGEKGQLRGEYAYLLPVEYCELWTQFVVVDKPNKIQMGIWQEFGAFEVIGNIYKNPELLGGD
jgi:uncharacterized phage protein (TIGR01671 family)